MHDLLFGPVLLTSLLGGVVALLATCCVSVMLPAYSSTVFRRRARVLAATLVFALGVATAIVPIGLGASALSGLLQQWHTPIWAAGGVAMLAGGIAVLVGWSPKLPMPGGRAPAGTGVGAIYGLGVFSSVASACRARVLIVVKVLAGATASFPAALAICGLPAADAPTPPRGRPPRRRQPRGTAAPRDHAPAPPIRSTVKPMPATPPKRRPATGRRPTKPVRVNTGPPWGRIAIFATVGVAVAAIIGLAIYTTRGGSSNSTTTPTIAGLVNYRTSDPGMLTRNHVTGPVSYPVSPPVGGNHNPVWQNCDGSVYTAPIANENAVHSLEHGAVWITYPPSLPPAQVAALAAKVRGTPYLLMSPYPTLDQPISLQAWGYQLKVTSAADPRIDTFITAFRIKAAAEPGAPCTGGTTATGTTPHSTPG